MKGPRRSTDGRATPPRLSLNPATAARSAGTDFKRKKKEKNTNAADGVCVREALMFPYT